MATIQVQVLVEVLPELTIFVIEALSHAWQNKATELLHEECEDVEPNWMPADSHDYKVVVIIEYSSSPLLTELEYLEQHVIDTCRTMRRHLALPPGDYSVQLCSSDGVNRNRREIIH